MIGPTNYCVGLPLIMPILRYRGNSSMPHRREGALWSTMIILFWNCATPDGR